MFAREGRNSASTPHLQNPMRTSGATHQTNDLQSRRITRRRTAPLLRHHLPMLFHQTPSLNPLIFRVHLDVFDHWSSNDPVLGRSAQTRIKLAGRVAGCKTVFQYFANEYWRPRSSISQEYYLFRLTLEARFPSLTMNSTRA